MTISWLRQSSTWLLPAIAHVFAVSDAAARIPPTPQCGLGQVAVGITEVLRNALLQGTQPEVLLLEHIFCGFPSSLGTMGGTTLPDQDPAYHDAEKWQVLLRPTPMCTKGKTRLVHHQILVKQNTRSPLNRVPGVRYRGEKGQDSIVT